jgi:DNA-binding NarL/FixJ family response regulator
MKSSHHQHKFREERSIRTLIVDDSNLVRTMLMDFLKSLPGMEVIGAASDGKDALKVMALRPADLVVMDLNMPLMDGLETMQRIREQHPATRVLLMSMSCTAEMKARALKAGADAFISKEEIHEKLMEAIALLFPGSEPVGPEPGNQGSR